MSIAYFVHELADAAVQRRIMMLAAAGRDVMLFGFDRVRDGKARFPEGAHVLGVTRNRRLFQRAGAVLLAIPRLMRWKRAWVGADLIIARNLEMLALAAIVTRLAGSKSRIAYECLDIHGLMLDRGPLGGLLRAVERVFLRRAALVITSSPAFERVHFRAAQRYAGPIMLAENKVLALAADALPPASRESRPPWVIAWCGMLRCRRSFEILRGLARDFPNKVHVELWGIPATDQIPEFHEAVAGNPNMTFRGRYAPAQLAEIYGRAHFAWTIDYYESGGNSDLLLPNRLYESLSFGAVPIAAAGVETARWLEAHTVGVILNEPVEHTLRDLFAALGSDGYAALQTAVARLDPELTRATRDSCRAFAEQLTGVAA